MSEKEYLFLQKCFSKYAAHLSPILNINMSVLLTSIKQDKVIQNIDQINILISFFQVINKQEKKEQILTSKKQKRCKIEQNSIQEKEQIDLFLENIRLFQNKLLIFRLDKEIKKKIDCRDL